MAGFWEGFDAQRASSDQRSMVGLNALNVMSAMQERQAQIPLRELALRKGNMEIKELEDKLARTKKIRDQLSAMSLEDVRTRAGGAQPPGAVSGVVPALSGGDPMDPAAQPNVTPSAAPASRQPVSQKDAISAKLLKTADIYEQNGDFEGATKLREHAAKFQPELFRIETVIGPDGKPRNVKVFKGGQEEAMAGTVTPKAHFVNQGDRTVMVDQNDPANVNKEFTTFQSPDNKATTTASIENNKRTVGAAWGGVKNAQERLAFDKLKQKADEETLQYLQTDHGIVGLPKKVSSSKDIVGRTVTNDMGEPLGRPMKDIPGTVMKAALDNNVSLTKVKMAIAALEGDPDKILPPGFVADRNAVGKKGYIMDPVLQRIDPGGTDTRAIIGDIGSLKMHDRNGAALTAVEIPRLRPFVPDIRDDPDVASSKLKQFLREYQQMQEEMLSHYSKDNGYRPYVPKETATNRAPSASQIPGQEVAPGITREAVDAEMRRRKLIK